MTITLPSSLREREETSRQSQDGALSLLLLTGREQCVLSNWEELPALGLEWHVSGRGVKSGT